MRLSAALTKALLAALCSAAPQEAWSWPSFSPEIRPPQIKTSSGTVVGTSAKIAPDVAAYLSIPFARPPVGPLRFAAPQKFKKPEATVYATKFGPDCPGTLDIGQRLPPDEDCLALSVWVPPKSKERLKAVMVWLYGGAFEGGSVAIPFTDGSQLAKNGDVIVVAINYRLSIFGFPGAEGLPEQNLGLLDQRAGVEWVRDNIQEFGGDPNRIVLFGESAGADSVDLYSYVHLQDPIVTGFIGQSGASTMCGLVTNASRENFPRVAARLGCGDGARLDTVECMRSKSAADIINAAKKLTQGFPPLFVPMPDGKVAFDNYPTRMREGKFIRAPFIIGNNDQEIGNNRQMNDQEFVCPAMQVAVSRRMHRVPAWRYRFYAGTEGGGRSTAVGDGLLNMVLGSVVEARAIHGMELPYVFGTLGSKAGALTVTALGQNTPLKEAVSDEFQSVWAAFAKDPVNGPTRLGWPVYEPTGSTLVRLGFGKERKSSVVRSNAFDDRCPVLQCSWDSLRGTFGVLGGLLAGASLGALAGQTVDPLPVQPPGVLTHGNADAAADATTDAVGQASSWPGKQDANPVLLGSAQAPAPPQSGGSSSHVSTPAAAPREALGDVPGLSSAATPRPFGPGAVGAEAVAPPWNGEQDSRFTSVFRAKPKNLTR